MWAAVVVILAGAQKIQAVLVTLNNDRTPFMFQFLDKSDAFPMTYTPQATITLQCVSNVERNVLVESGSSRDPRSVRERRRPLTLDSKQSVEKCIQGDIFQHSFHPDTVDYTYYCNGGSEINPQSLIDIEGTVDISSLPQEMKALFCMV